MAQYFTHYWSRETCDYHTELLAKGKIQNRLERKGSSLLLTLA